MNDLDEKYRQLLVWQERIILLRQKPVLSHSEEEELCLFNSRAQGLLDEIDAEIAVIDLLNEVFGKGPQVWCVKTDCVETVRDLMRETKIISLTMDWSFSFSGLSVMYHVHYMLK